MHKMHEPVENNESRANGQKIPNAGCNGVEDNSNTNRFINGNHNGTGADLSDEDIPNHQLKYVPGKGIHRYDNSLKNLIPIRRNTKEKGAMPTDSAGLFSFVFYSWLSRFMYKAGKKGLKIDELPTVSPYDSCDYNADRLELLWEEELAKNGPEKASFSTAVWRFCRMRIIVGCLLVTGVTIFSLLSYTVCMRKLLEHVETGDGNYSEGMKWVLLLLASELSRVLTTSWTYSVNIITALRMRSACLTLLNRKIIRMNNFGNKNVGEVINLFANDGQKVFDMIFKGTMIFAAPVTTIYLIIYTVKQLSAMALLGMITFLLFYPIQLATSRLLANLRSKTARISDTRVRLMNEILESIKLIKMYGWEKSFAQNLRNVRKRERQLLLKTSYIQNSSFTLAPAVPNITGVVAILAHVSSGNNLKAAEIFPYIATLDTLLRVCLNLLLDSTGAIISGGVSLKRIESVLLLKDGNFSIFKPINTCQAVVIKHATFSYITLGCKNNDNLKQDEKKRITERTNQGDKSEEEKLNKPEANDEFVDILFDISFEATKGKLVGICGHVGSGKSSLLLAALGQLRVSNGEVMRDGSCAYVSQQAWITNATLRENILFGEKFDSGRYNKAIHACSLSQEIGMMPGGDQTEIGEKGINLSGGQKQRVALARALYADRDIYFLDDPLSAVDSRVGSYIFDNLILGALSEKTVIFVTHQIQYLNRCDDIYMMRDGRIIEHGTHDELIKLASEYFSLVTAISADDKTEDETIIDQRIATLPHSMNNITLHDRIRTRTMSAGSRVEDETIGKSDTPGTQLTVVETVQQGTIKASTYHSYVLAAGGYFFSALVISIFFLSIASSVFNSWWLALWINAGGGNATIVRNNVTTISDNVGDNPDFWYYRAIYAGSMGLMLSISLLRALIFTRASIGASTKMHNELFSKIIASPMRFFDTTPIGRIQHLFSRDMDEVDTVLPMVILFMLPNGLILLFSLGVICSVFPWFILPLCIISTVYYFVTKIFRTAINDMKRMENTSRAPIISFITATVEGLDTIHAFRKENAFMRQFTSFFDENSKCQFIYNSAMRWLAVRIDMVSVLMTGILGFLIIALRDQVSPALAGLALAYSTQITNGLQFTVRLISEAEVEFISVERIDHYIKTLKTEGHEKEPTIKPPSSWPAEAQIKFTNVTMAYGEGTPIILKDVSFAIRTGEKIGIVGRTGSGKSSLTVALFRLVELVEGKIEINDVDISKISLSQLRTKLSIIPQDPILFSGTVRSNLDPFKLYTDAEIWEALEKTELKDRIQSITGQLDASVGFGGDNLSLGEKQLLCLSRALLRNSKILVLDEATAAVDPETEIVVQKTVQHAFPDCTILTIAHRLQTVLPLDRVLVMDSGKVLEFDTPANLLEDPSSEFSKMMAAAERAERL